MVYEPSSKILAPVAKLLPPEAMASFVTAANESAAASLDHNEAMKAGWAIVRMGWERPSVGKRWVRKDNPTSGDVHVDVPMGVRPPKKPKEEQVAVKAAEPTTLYVSRPVLNAEDIRAWAKEQGFKTALPAEDMHVTLAFSRTPFDHSALVPEAEPIVVLGADDRSVEAMGDGAAVGLLFKHQTLADRHQAIKTAGASWDWPEFKPHVTVTFDAADVDLGGVNPYDGPLVLGPEKFEPVKEDWSANMTEEAVKVLKITKIDEEQRMAYGWASVISIKGRPFEDSQGDIIDAETLTKAITDFMMDVRRSMAMHERNADGGIEDSMVKGIVVHSFPITADIAKSLGISSDNEGWIVGVKVNDDALWTLVKSGAMAAFSIGGRGYRENADGIQTVKSF